MKAYVVRNDDLVVPLGEPARDCLILNKKLAQLQAEALAASGLEVVYVCSKPEISDKGEYLMLNDNVFFTPALLAEFLRQARNGKRVAVCALKNGVTTQRTAVSLQDVVRGNDFTQYNLCYIPEEGHDNLSRVILINPDRFFASIKVPRHMCESGEYKIPMTDNFIIQIDHWVNLWSANIVGILAEGARLQKKTWPEKLWLAVRAGSLNRWNILWHLNNVGRNCDIHPTAYIEGSAIGDNVTVGAGAVVRASVIGGNVTIGNNVVIEESVIGEGSSMLVGHVLYSVFYPGVFSVAEMITASILGRDTFMGSNSILTDFRVDGRNVTVMKDGRPFDSGNLFLGSCVGHRTRIGSGTIVAPGRTIPCGLQIIARQERVVLGKFDDLRAEGPLIKR